MGFGKFDFEGDPCFGVCGKTFPFLAFVGEESRVEDEGVGSVCRLDGGDWSLAMIGVSHGVLDLLEEELDGEVGVVRRFHTPFVLFEVTRADLGIRGVEVGEEVEDGHVTVADVRHL